jgi:serine phosphatase RsbU (regulator of sigma subunit)
LVKRGRVLGALELGRQAGGRRFDDDDLAAVEAMAARVASSITNMRLSDEQRRIATALQASLLPAYLPAIPGIDVAVRYWAAGEGIEVGVDFYDLFEIDETRWAVVIGDVCGKGPHAAALTGMARHTIATAAWHGGDHATVLSALDRSMKTRGSRDFCTAVYGTLTPRGSGFEFTFVCGGHPPPVVVRADGTFSFEGTYGDLIGLSGRFEVTPTTTTLGHGDVVVLYTDGITDVRPPHALSEQQLAGRAASASADAATAEDIARRLEHDLEAVLPRQSREDDVALVVLRVI